MIIEVNDIRQQRQLLGITQAKLAALAGCSREYLNQIETGNKKASEEITRKLEDALAQLASQNDLQLLIDYVRIRFKTIDPRYVMEDILRMKEKYFLHEPYGFYSYPEHYRFGDMIICSSHDMEKGILLELKGKGCRQFELILEAQNRNWFDFFQRCLESDSIFKRLDIAIDDQAGLLNVPVLAQKCDQEECVSVFRTFKHYRSGELIKHEENAGQMGHTLYIGSLRSDIYFCVYEKNYEQYVKANIALEEAEVKNRFEVRLKNDRATLAMRDLLTHKDLEKTVFGIIHKYVRFVDRDDNKQRSSWKMNHEWAYFIGEKREKLSLTMQPQPYTLERTLNWLARQVAPTLKMALLLDEIRGENLLNTIIHQAELSEKQLKIIDQQSRSLKEIIL